MIKKLSIIMLIIIISFSPIAFANDGGPYTAGSEKLEVILKPKTNTLEIGEKFTVQMILKNNDIYPILLDDISYMLEGMYIGLDVEDIPSSEIFINPGTSAYYDVSFTVDETINWYVKDGKYFVDVNPTIYYEAAIEDPPADFVFDRDCGRSDYYWYFFNKEITPIPIEITNLNDGSSMAALQVQKAAEDVYFYYDDTESHSYDGEYRAYIRQEITIENIGTDDIDEIYVPSGKWNVIPDDTFTVAKNEEITQIVYNYYYIKPENIPGVLKANYSAIIKQDGKYYGIIKEEELTTHILQAPQIKFDFNQIEESEGKGSCTVIMENISGSAYDNLIYYTDTYTEITNIDDAYYEKYVMSPKDKLIIPIYFEADSSGSRLQIGYLINEYVYLWRVYFEYQDGTISNVEISPYACDYHISGFFDDICPRSTKSPEAAAVAETAAKETPAPVEKQYEAAQESISDVPGTFSPKPMPADTAQDAEIVKTSERPNIPIGIYAAFAAAAAAVCVMIYLMIRKSKEKHSTD